MNREKSSKFDPNKSFFSLPIVHNTTLTIVALSLSISVMIIINSDLWESWNFTYQGFNNLLEYFKIPLGILALLIPIGAVYAANHRSEQTKQQLKLTEKQNLFTNYYKHLEEFEKYSGKIAQTMQSPVLQGELSLRVNFRHVHNLLYPNLIMTGEISVNENFIRRIETAISNLSPIVFSSNFTLTETSQDMKYMYSELCDDLESQDIDLEFFSKTQHFEHINRIDEWFSSSMKERTFTEEQKSQANEAYAAYRIIDYLFRIEMILELFDSLARFDSSYISSGVLKKLKESECIEAKRAGGEPLDKPRQVFLKIKNFHHESSNAYFSSEHPVTEKAFISYTMNLLAFICDEEY